MRDGGDTDWLGLAREGEGRWSFELTPELSRFDGKFFGGTGIAVATALLEAETGRHARWCTVQFASTTDTGARIDCDVEVLAAGRRTSQVRITGRVGDSVLFAALGAAAVERPGELAAQFGSMPDVDPPDLTQPWAPRSPVPIDAEAGWFALADIREAKGGAKMQAIWARLRSRPLTRGALGFLADMVPSAVVRAAGRAGAGTSLDNTVRYGPEPDRRLDARRLRPLLHRGRVRARRRQAVERDGHTAWRRQPDRIATPVRLTPLRSAEKATDAPSQVNEMMRGCALTAPPAGGPAPSSA